MVEREILMRLRKLLQTNLPARVIVPDHLTEALMNLLHTVVEHRSSAEGATCQLHVETLAQGADVLVRITCNALSAQQLIARTEADPRMESIRRRVVAMGGRMNIVGESIEVALPPEAASQVPAQ